MATATQNGVSSNGFPPLPGAFADLLVIDGNPLEDIRVLTTPDQTLMLIMKDGQIYKNQL